VYPSIQHSVEPLPHGGAELVFPSLIPKEEVTVSYLYFPPDLWSNINTHLKCDQGFVRTVDVLPTPRPPRWLLNIIWFLIISGAAGLAYVGWEIVSRLVA
jgi:hypothetical protein